MSCTQMFLTNLLSRILSMFQDGLLAQNQRDTIEQIYRKCPKMSSDGKRLQVGTLSLSPFELTSIKRKSSLNF